MKLAYLGAISTGIVVVLSIALVVPAFTVRPHNVQLVMLAFNMKDSDNVDQWCNDLSAFLSASEIKATVFVTGQVAESNPGCLRTLSANENLDIGSQTYSYKNLTAIPDYLVELDEVKKGKNAVDTVGSIDSKLFKAPFDATDDNIYSLLSRSDILADFSYTSQYNKYSNGQFIRFDLKSYSFSKVTLDLSLLKQSDYMPIMINIDSSIPVEDVGSLVTEIVQRNITLVNASELTGMDLTIRKGDEK